LKIPSADAFAKNIEIISSTFTVGTQQDPSEFLIFLLNHLIQSLSSNEKSITSIQHMFGINIRRKTRCHICSNEFYKSVWESVLAISIDDHTSVTEAVKAFFEEELLTGEDLYECVHCKGKVPGSTKLDIMKASPIVFINLRKFTYNKNIGRVTKIHRFISFPEILNLGRYVNTNVSDSNEENDSISHFTYKLYAVVVHRGDTPVSGHIFSYIRSPDGFWYEFNDETVTQVQFNVVLSEKDAYILCYAETSIESVHPLEKISINSSINSSSIITSTPINSRLNERQKLDHNFNLVRM
jgi:ubiquitin carboxyl-terminal hydrolase 36/42